MYNEEFIFQVYVCMYVNVWHFSFAFNISESGVGSGWSHPMAHSQYRERHNGTVVVEWVPLTL